MLAQTPSEIVSDPRKYLSLFYGFPGVGKTTLASEIDGHYVLATEAGTSGVSVFQTVVTSWLDYIKMCQELKGGIEGGWKDQREIKTVVVDSYDAIWSYCADYVMANETFLIKGKACKFSRVDDVEYGKAYKRVTDYVVGTFRRLRLLGFGVVVLARAKEKQIEWNGQKLEAIGINGSALMEDGIVAECDVVGLMSAEEEFVKDEKLQIISKGRRHYIYCQPTLTRRAKHRLRGFPERIDNPVGAGWQEYCRVFAETLRHGSIPATTAFRLPV